MTRVPPKFRAGQHVWHPLSGVGVVTGRGITATHHWRYFVGWIGQPGLRTVEYDWSDVRAAEPEEVEAAMLMVELALDSVG